MKFCFGIPTYFDFANNFSYFETLANTENNFPSAARYKSNLYKNAKKEANKALDLLSNDSTQVVQAIEFLKIAAESERKKEMAVIEAYKDELQNKFQNNQEIMSRIGRIFSGYNPNNPNQFYKDLIYLFNLIRRDYVSLQNKLDKLKQTLEKNEEVYAKNFILRSDGIIRTLIRRLNETSRSYKKDSERNFDRTIQDAVFRIISNQSYLNAIENNPENLAALAAVIEIDLMNILDEKMYKQQKETLDDLSTVDIEKVVMEYIDGKYHTKLLNLLNNDHRQLFNLLADAKDLLGIRTLNDAEYEKQKKVQASYAKYNKDKLGSFFDQAGIKQRKLLQGLKRITVSSSTDTSHGLIGELTSLTIERLNSRNVGGSAAVDNIQAGSANFTIMASDTTNDYLDSLVKAVERGNKLINSGNKDIVESAYTAMNNQIRDAEKKIDQYLEELKVQDKFFIYHESTKTYKSLYQGKSKALHGRSVSAFTYITELYAAAGTNLHYDNLTLPAQDWLNFIVMNLFTGGVAEEAKEPLEKYFSIFAGLLMFDDAVNIARDAAKGLETSRVNSIHLYNINQVYIPASFLLQSLYEELIKSSLMLDNGAKVVISDASAVAIKEEQDENVPYYARWYNVSKAVQKSTKVNIVFLSSFLETIRNL